MKKSEFKEMIKESVKEVLVEEGVLKSVISEVVKAVQETNQTSTPSTPTEVQEFIKDNRQKEAAQTNKKLHETKKKMLDAIGASSYGGIDLFEGTTPLKKGGSPDSSQGPSSTLEGVDPTDAGVDISGILGSSAAWKQLIK
jgi:hypothetical protein